MQRVKKHRPSASMLVACVALFVALGGVGYAAATIGSAAIVDNSIRGKDVRDETLRGKDVREKTLGKVPSAASADTAASAANADTVGGVPPSALTIGRSDLGTCSPGGAFVQCASVTLSMPREGRVLLDSSGQWHSDDPDGIEVEGECRIDIDGAAHSSETEEGSSHHHSDGDHEQAVAGITIVTDLLPAGDHTFTLACVEESGDMDFTDMRISAVLLGSA